MSNALPKIGHNSANFEQSLDTDTSSLKRYRAKYATGVPRKVRELEFEALDLKDARRRLRVMLSTPNLPPDLEIIELASLEAEARAKRTRRARFLLRALAEHFRWLAGTGGARAELPGLDLSEIVLEGRDLTQANFRGSDLSRACLRKSRLSGANLSGAVLVGADLRGTDLRGADLSNADLRGAVLIGADLDGVDVWRANFAGAIITPEVLHKALNCKRRAEELTQSSLA